MGSTMQELRDLRSDPEYLNFIAVGEALRILGDGLRHYTEQKAKELQEQLLKKLGGYCNCLYTAGIKRCRHTCKWGKELEKLHANKKKNRIPFHQSDSKLWHDPNNGYWEVAKVFMHDLGAKWRDVKEPATTDLTGLLNFLIFCKHSKVQQKLLMSVRDLRNDWAHTKNYKFSASEKQAAFIVIDNLMNDAELLSCKEVQDCRPRIYEVENADVSIVYERDLEVLQELTRHQEFTRERDTEKKQEKLMNLLELILSSRNNDHPQSYTSDNQFKEDLIYLGITFIEFLLLPVKVIQEYSRWKIFSFLTLVMLLLSCVSDNSVFVSDYGCSRPVTISPINSFGFNEFDFTTHLSYKRENFFGRSWFFRELGDIFENIDAPVGVLITGDPGSGKSALVSQLICSPFSSLAIYDNIIGYHVCDYSEKGKQNGARFVRNLVDQIASNIPEYASHIINKVPIQTELDKHCHRDPTSCFFTTIIGPLRELRKRPDNFKYIVIDALDECIEKDGETSAILDILHYKMSYFPQWLKIIMSSRNGTTVTSKVPRTVRRMPLNPDDEGNIEDIRSYISRYLRKKFSFISKLYKAISPLEDSTNEITNELLKRAEGNFLFVKTILQNNLEADGTFNFNSLPNSLDDMHYQLFQRYFIKEDFDRYEIIFEVLLASGSLRKTEFFAILKRENQDKGMEELVERVNCLLRFGQDETVSIYHQSFAEWLVNNHVKGFSIQKSRGHEYIANFLVDRLRSNHNITFSELSRLCMHVLNSGGPSDYHKEHLKLLNVSKIRNQHNGRCIFHELVQRKNGYLLLEVFLSSFVSIDIPDLEGKTPAFYAASEGLLENLKPFLDKGTCANCILNNLSTLDEIKAVIQMKGYEELSTMHIATYNGHTEVVDTLLKHNASFIQFNENVPTLLHVAAERGHLDLVKSLYNNGDQADIISLHHAAARNNSQVVKYLLETAGVKDECFQCKQMNTYHFYRNRSFYDLHYMFCETALHAAVSKRHTNITKLLLQFGNSAMECKHHSGKTPLMDAVERNDTEMAEILLQNGANVEEKCGEKVSLSHGDPQTSGLRYFYGKTILYTFYREKTSCPCGNKALHLCAKYGLWHMAKYLINSWNASVLDKNCNGESVWKIANVSYNQDFIYHVNRMLLNLDDKPASAQLGMAKYQRRTFKKLLRKFFMRTKPYQSSFQCDSTFEGMSPLHIAALMGMDMLNRVYKKAHEIAPSLPLNCTNKHWITPRYLAYFYDSIHALTDESRLKQTRRRNNEYTKTMLQYPDREAEFHMIYNYFYHSPSPKTNVLTYQSLPKLPDYDVTNCPGFYDLLPESKALRAKSYCPRIQERHDDEYHDPAKAELRKMKYCENEKPVFCLCIDEYEIRMLFEQYAKDCFCPIFMWELQRWFTSFPKHNRRINQFIAERMGWKDFGNGDFEKRWPVYFLYKKIKNEYQSYKYLEILNEGFKIDDMDDDDDDDDD